MNEAQVLLITGAVIGAALGALAGYAIAWERLIRRERPTLKLTIDPQVLNQITGEMIAVWLAERSLVAMPKGKEFSWPGAGRR